MKANWMTIHVKDLEVSKAFYVDYLGMELEREFSPDGERVIAFLKAGDGFEIELMQHRDPAMAAVCKGVSLGITCSNYEELLETAEKRSMITMGPMVVGGHLHCFFVSDPDGVGIQILKEA